MINEKMREEFEKWFEKNNIYEDDEVKEVCFKAWQASRENIEIELPKYQLYPDLESDIKFNILEEIKQKLIEQGFKVK